MKKRIIKATVFCLLFMLLFAMVQNVLHYRWHSDPDYYSRNIDLARQPKDSVDLLAFGTSEMNMGFIPMAAYEEAGITAYNFGTSYKSSITTYYQLLYALKHQRPKVVVCDFSCLFTEPLPGQNGAIYCQVVDTFPDLWLKTRLVADICWIDREQKFLEWMFPLFIYHSLWESMSLEEFIQALPWDYTYLDTYPAFCKGSQMGENVHHSDMKNADVVPSLWNPGDYNCEWAPLAVEYYDRIINLCHKNGIQVVALCFPSVTNAARDSARWENLKAYLDSRNVAYLNYASYEQYQALGMDLERDYFDNSHLNLTGADRFTRTVSRELSQLCSLPDRRQDSAVCTAWNAQLEEYRQYYQNAQ